MPLLFGCLLETQRRTVLEEASKLGRVLPCWLQLAELLPIATEQVFLNLHFMDLIGDVRSRHVVRDVEQHSRFVPRHVKIHRN